MKTDQLCAHIDSTDCRRLPTLSLYRLVSFAMHSASYALTLTRAVLEQFPPTLRVTWVTANFETVTVGTQTFYDLTQPLSGGSATTQST